MKLMVQKQVTRGLLVTICIISACCGKWKVGETWLANWASVKIERVTSAKFRTACVKTTNSDLQIAVRGRLRVLRTEHAF